MNHQNKSAKNSNEQVLGQLRRELQKAPLPENCWRRGLLFVVVSDYLIATFLPSRMYMPRRRVREAYLITFLLFPSFCVLCWFFLGMQRGGDACGQQGYHHCGRHSNLCSKFLLQSCFIHTFNRWLLTGLKGFEGGGGCCGLPDDAAVGDHLCERAAAAVAGDAQVEGAAAEVYAAEAHLGPGLWQAWAYGEGVETCGANAEESFGDDACVEGAFG